MKNIILKILAALPALLLSSCVYEDLYPCPEGISLRFVYNYNMEYADAFSSRVDCLTLYVYDGNGKHVGTYTETGDVLRNEDYRMVIDLPEGSYKFVAYGGLACERHSFSVTSAMADDFSMEDVEVSMEHDDFISRFQLHDLFWGMTDADVAYEEYSDAVIYMMKDTHDIRIILQQSDTGAEPLSIEDFDISITGMNNYHFLWDNSVSSDGPDMTYLPWTSGDGLDVGSAGGNNVSAAYAEFSLSRVMADSRAKLVIYSYKQQETVVDIPLVQYLLLLKSEKYADMDSQEYLDRESSWNIVFLLNDYTWHDVDIIINDWTVRDNNIGLS